jgi:hypothetical protein
VYLNLLLTADTLAMVIVAFAVVKVIEQMGEVNCDDVMRFKEISQCEKHTRTHATHLQSPIKILMTTA